MSPTDPSNNSLPPAPRRRPSLLHVAVIAIAAGVGLAMFLWSPRDNGSTAQSASQLTAVTPPLAFSSSAGASSGKGDAGTNPTDPASQTADASTQPAESDDEQHRRMLLGQWTQLKDGKRHFTIHEDGTGLMIVEPEAIYALVVGARIEMDITWKIENGRAVFDSIRGRPEGSYAWVCKVMGTHRDRRIVEMTDDRLLLHDDEDDSQTEWTRVKAAK